MQEEEIRKNFGQNLLKLRKYNKMSQQELAAKLSYSDKAISKWELGDNIPDVMTLNKIAEIFNVTVDELIHPNVSLSKSAVTKKKRLLISTISSGLAVFVCFVALLVLSILKYKGGIDSEILDKFIFSCYPIAFLLGGVVLIVFTCLWFEKIWRLLAISLCIWSASFIAMIWLNFELVWLVILIAVLGNILFAILLKIEK